MTQTRNNKKNFSFLGSVATISLLGSLALTACQSSTEKTTEGDTSKPTTTENTTGKDTSENKDAPAENSLTASWESYNAYDGSYTVSFPKKPTEKKDYLDTALGKVFFSEASYTEGEKYYSTSHTTYPVDPKQYDVQKGLDGSRDGISKSIGMEIVREEKIEIGGFPAREVEMKGKDGSLLAHLIFDPNGPTLYQIFVVTGEGEASSPENKAFLDSFKLKRK
jgi:hypothetical protein